MDSQCVIEPRMLKDFLQDQNLSFPRSRKSTFSVFLHAAFSSIKSSFVLYRSISRRFSKSTQFNKSMLSSGLPEPTMERSTSVTVKDILRWKSSRDLTVDPEENDFTVKSFRDLTVDPEENDVSLSSDFIVESDSPSRCMTTTTSAGTPRSSWCDSDFTVGDSPVSCHGFSTDIEVTGKKNFHINVAGGERLRQITIDPKSLRMDKEGVGAWRDPMNSIRVEGVEGRPPLNQNTKDPSKL
ncbi:hypothetical protein L2E82_36715 [Cichorium intybus]|uniref:Uncharacterized protein n=1 Tax=Cichorium intybus TaxID=13427 RepID=A0ACB9AEB7_CICIN|nr:hypothetical protein L2E82_36715 [Cichorium intybus]